MTSTTQAARWNTMAVLGFVCLFVFSPFALIFGGLGVSQIARTGERGRALAMIAIVLGTLKLIGSLVKLLMLIALGSYWGGFYDSWVW